MNLFDFFYSEKVFIAFEGAIDQKYRNLKPG